MTSRSTDIINLIIWHCSATPKGRETSVDEITAWHQARGFDTIGYHYVVLLDGTVKKGRSPEIIGAHCAGNNRRSIGCCYIGGMSADGKKPEDTRTIVQKAAMLQLTKYLVKTYPITRIAGHNEFARKACPSFDVRRDPIGSIARLREQSRTT